MHARQTSIAGAWEFASEVHEDERGCFLEAFSSRSFEEVTGRDLALAQINVSVSRKGVIRGVHFSERPRGQAKYVMCVSGTVRDIIVDLRVDSANLGKWEAVILSQYDRNAVFIPEGLGHAFQVLSDEATVVYVTTSPYDPVREFSVNPLDPELALPWENAMASVVSRRDRQSQSFREYVDRKIRHL